TDLRGLPKGVTSRQVVEAQQEDVAVWELTADAQAAPAETAVTVVAQVGPGRAEGHFKLTVANPQAAAKAAAFGPARPKVEGRWHLQGRELIQDGDGVATLLFGDPGWKDYVVTVEAQVGPGSAGVGVAVRALGADRALWLNLGQAEDGSRFAVESAEPDKPPVVLAKQEGALKPKRWYKIRIEVHGEWVQCSLDDADLFLVDTDKQRHPAGGVGLRGRAAARFRNLQVADLSGNVLLAGVDQIDPKAAL